MDTLAIVVFLATAMVVLEVLQIYRRGVSEHRGHLILLSADLTLLGWTIRGERWHSWQAVVGLVGAAALVLLPSLVESLVRRAIQRDRLRLAARLAAFKELLTPGAAATAQRELFGELADVRAGQVEAVVRRLRARLVEAEGQSATAIHERIITALVFGDRHAEAISHYEAHAGRDHPARHPALALHMMRSFGEEGDLERAGQIVHRLEQAAVARDPGAQAVLQQARLQLVAYAGQPELLAQLLAEPALRRLPAHQRKLLEDAARRRATAVNDERVVEFARTVGDRLLQELRRPERGPAMPRRYLATLALIVLNGAVYLTLTRLGRFHDGYDLVRAGASFYAAVRAGEWWRLVTALFLHDGSNPLHVTLNMLTLYVFGRYVEPIFGWARFLVVYLVAGLVGNLTSLLVPGRGTPAVISLGASGAVFGLVGALMVTLVLRRGSWPEPYRRTLLVNLVVLSLLQLLFGAFTPVVDNWAHIGGGFGGAVAALVVVPGGLLGNGRASRVVLAGAVLALAAVLGLSTVAVARTRTGATLARLPSRQWQVGPIRVTAPAYAVHSVVPEPDWPGQEMLEDAIAEVDVTAHLVPLPADGLAGALHACVERDRVAIEKMSRENPKLELRVEAGVAPPVAGWEGKAQRHSASRRGLLLYYARISADPKQALVVELGLRDSQRHRAQREAVVTSLLSSIR